MIPKKIKLRLNTRGGMRVFISLSSVKFYFLRLFEFIFISADTLMITDAMAKIFSTSVSSIPLPSSVTFTEVTLISIASDSRVTGLEYDPVDKKIYWVERDNNIIKRSDVDGMNQEDIATSGTGRHNFIL